ncbi:sugar-binding domain-containing protein [Sinomicrobium sp. M5D2P9]
MGGKNISLSKKREKRLFIHFGAVNYLAEVYLNGEHIGQYEGGYTPFQFEITDQVRDEENRVIVKVNNKRSAEYIPALSFDWFNYGGITRDVNLIETPGTFIEGYLIRLRKDSENEVAGKIRLNGKRPSQTVRIKISKLKIVRSVKTDSAGNAPVSFNGNFELWSLENPKLYTVVIESETNTISDLIGFRNIEVRGRDILLNDNFTILIFLP